VVRSLARSAVEEARGEAGNERSSTPADLMPDRQDLTVKQARDAGGEPTTHDPGDVPENSDTGIKKEEAGSSEEGIAPAEEPTHVVQRGDTLHSIGRRYGVPWQTLMTHNKLDDSTDLNVGQILRIPPKAEAAGGSGQEGETLYTVQHGDSLYEIGLLFGMSWKRIAERNGLADPGQIFVGQVLRIPSKQSLHSPP
jgi:LysM repeat protein